MLDKEYLNTKQAAEHLGVSRARVFIARRQQKNPLNCITVPQIYNGVHYYYLRSDLDKWKLVQAVIDRKKKRINEKKGKIRKKNKHEMARLREVQSKEQRKKLILKQQIKLEKWRSNNPNHLKNYRAKVRFFNEGYTDGTVLKARMLILEARRKIKQLKKNNGA